MPLPFARNRMFLAKAQPFSSSERDKRLVPIERMPSFINNTY